MKLQGKIVSKRETGKVFVCVCSHSWVAAAALRFDAVWLSFPLGLLSGGHCVPAGVDLCCDLGEGEERWHLWALLPSSFPQYASGSCDQSTFSFVQMRRHLWPGRLDL